MQEQAATSLEDGSLEAGAGGWALGVGGHIVWLAACLARWADGWMDGWIWMDGWMASLPLRMFPSPPPLTLCSPTAPPPAEPSAAAAPADAVPLRQYQQVVLKAKAYRNESRQLAGQLRRMTAKAAKLKKAAEALRCVVQLPGGTLGVLGVLCHFLFFFSQSPY